MSRNYADKLCAECRQSFTPTGARSLKCPECKSGTVSKPARATPTPVTHEGLWLARLEQSGASASALNAHYGLTCFINGSTDVIATREQVRYAVFMHSAGKHILTPDQLAEGLDELMEASFIRELPDPFGGSNLYTLKLLATVMESQEINLKTAEEWLRR